MCKGLIQGPVIDFREKAVKSESHQAPQPNLLELTQLNNMSQISNKI